MAKIYGQLEKAQLENLSSNPSAGVTGAAWFNTTDVKMYVDDGTNIRAMLRNDSKLILGNSGTANDNIRLHRGATSTLQFVLGGDATAEGSMSGSLAIVAMKHESYATGSLPTAGQTGRIVYDTTTNAVKVDNGSSFVHIDSGKLLTTKGDILTYSTLPVRLGVGSDGQAIVADSTQATGIKWAAVGGGLVYTAQTANYSAAVQDFVDCTANTFTVTIPTAAGNTGKEIVVKNSGTGVITVAFTGGETADGYSTIDLSNQKESISLISDGTNWKIREYKFVKSRASFSCASGSGNLSSLGGGLIRIAETPSVSGGNDLTATQDGTNGSKIVCNYAGWVWVTWGIDQNNGANYSWITINGSRVENNAGSTVGSTLNSHGTASMHFKVAAGDYIQMYSTAGNVNVMLDVAQFGVLLEKEL